MTYSEEIASGVFDNRLSSIAGKLIFDPLQPNDGTSAIINVTMANLHQFRTYTAVTLYFNIYAPTGSVEITTDEPYNLIQQLEHETNPNTLTLVIQMDIASNSIVEIGVKGE